MRGGSASRRSRRSKNIIGSSYEDDYYFDNEDDQFEIDDVSPIKISPKGVSQEEYWSILKNFNHKLVFGIGPAGTGKTMLACCAAIDALQNHNYKKIIITRPTVSVEEDLGFLPGSLEEKMDPWLRPLLDIFSEYYTSNTISWMLKEKILEISPLAFMRGRTFNDSYIIADEMQNSTVNQMKCLLTRIGNNSKMIVTGDLNQHDCKFRENGLKDIISRIKGKNYKRIHVTEFSAKDVQRSSIVKDVLEIYSSKD